MTYKWTSTQFDQIKSSFVCCFGALGHDVARKYVYGDPENCETEYLMREMFLILWAINDWQQNDNGSTTGLTNFLTQSQLNDLVNRGKTICGCC